MYAAWEQDMYLKNRDKGVLEGWARISAGKPEGWEKSWLIWLRLAVDGELSEPMLFRGGVFPVWCVVTGKAASISMKAAPLKAESGWWNAPWWRWRCRLLQRLEEHWWQSSDATAMSRALVSGNRDGLSAGRLNAYYRLNLGHLLAISGLNVGILYVACSGMLTRLRLPFWCIKALALFTVFAYGCLGGWSISLKRAVLLCTLAVLAFALGKAYQNVRLNALIFLAWLEWVLDPGVFDSVAYWLTYLGTAGIFIMLPLWERSPDKERKSKGYFKWKAWMERGFQAWSISWGAVALSWPVVAMTFGVMPYWCLILAVPLMSLFTFVLMAVLGGVVWTLVIGQPATWSDYCSQAYTYLVEGLSGMEAWVWPVDQIHGAWLGFYYFALSLMLLGWRVWKATPSSRPVS